jgi:hypothetical protein
MHTPLRTIEIAKVSQYLFLNKIQRSNLFGGGTDLGLPEKIYNIRKSVEWAYLNGYVEYDMDILQDTLNYLYALCTPYNITSQAILDVAYIVTETTGEVISTEDDKLFITERT